uniref:RNase H domain-containing protein n=1 Tax=Rhodnius prolixus TaxID=13249 RepID=T1HRN3_RHOPR
MLGECYPSPPWTHIYTDGSAEGATKNAGAGVYGTNFQFSEPVGTWTSNFDGEIRAILIGLRYAVDRKLDQVVFLSDSQVALIAVTGAKGEFPLMQALRPTTKLGVVDGVDKSKRGGEMENGKAVRKKSALECFVTRKTVRRTGSSQSTSSWVTNAHLHKS